MCSQGIRAATMSTFAGSRARPKPRSGSPQSRKLGRVSRHFKPRTAFFLWITAEASHNPTPRPTIIAPDLGIGNQTHEDAMAYPGDFVAANRAARTDPQRPAIHLCKKRRVSDLCRALFPGMGMAGQAHSTVHLRTRAVPLASLAIASAAQAGSTSREKPCPRFGLRATFSARRDCRAIELWASGHNQR